MGFFNNIKNIKDQALEIDSIQNIDQLQGIFDKIDDQAEKEKEKKKEEKEYFESLSVEEKVEYKRIQKRNQNLKRLGMYGLTVAGMATGVGIPVLMAANIGRIMADDNLTFDQEKHDEKSNVYGFSGSDDSGSDRVRSRETGSGADRGWLQACLGFFQQLPHQRCRRVQ